MSGSFGFESWLLALAAVLSFVLIGLLVARRRRKRRERHGSAAAEAGESAPGPPAGVPDVPAMSRLRAALERSRASLLAGLEAVRGSRDLERWLSALEETLIASDVGFRTAGRILEGVRRKLSGDGAFDEKLVRSALREVVEEILGDEPEPPREAKPWVILVTGVNGVGKTTTIGKLAARFRAEGKTVLVVAADTFRAAAIDQLEAWAAKAGADFVRHRPGADPGAVAYDGVRAAVARGRDVVLIDTAGRLHTRENLMEELRKVARVVAKALPGAPHEVLLVLDATTGQNALRQAKAFSGALGVSGIVLAKLDGTAKGGAALAVREELGVPIRYVGVGERIEDLRPFSAREFARALVGD